MELRTIGLDQGHVKAIIFDFETHRTLYVTAWEANAIVDAAGNDGQPEVASSYET